MSYGSFIDDVEWTFINQNNWWETIGVPRDASRRVIKQKFRELCKRYHPDVNKSQTANSRFLMIKNAYETAMQLVDY